MMLKNFAFILSMFCMGQIIYGMEEFKGTIKGYLSPIAYEKVRQKIKKEILSALETYTQNANKNLLEETIKNIFTSNKEFGTFTLRDIFKDRDPKNPLFKAIDNNNEVIFKVLKDFGIDINVLDTNGHVALRRALEMGRTDLALLIMDTPGFEACPLETKVPQPKTATSLAKEYVIEPVAYVEIRNEDPKDKEALLNIAQSKKDMGTPPGQNASYVEVYKTLLTKSKTAGSCKLM